MTLASLTKRRQKHTKKPTLDKSGAGHVESRWSNDSANQIVACISWSNQERDKGLKSERHPNLTGCRPALLPLNLEGLCGSEVADLDRLLCACACRWRKSEFRHSWALEDLLDEADMDVILTVA
jgi:hypothetical protein